jgi:hypothetical protein
MGMIMNRSSFEKLIDEDIKWLEDIMQKTNPHSLEGKHIVDCLKMMPELLYDYYYKKA